MLFSSMIFLLLFLPGILVLNFILSAVPFRSDTDRMYAKNFVLLAASLFFYAWGGIRYLFIMLFSIGVNFLGGYVLDRWKENHEKRRTALILVIAVNIGTLFFFKYFNMLVIMIEAVLQPGRGVRAMLTSMLSMKGTGALGLPQIVLPIGISFFTFQAMSYVIDVYKGKARAQKKLVPFALYVSLFPQLIAGPIVKYSDVDQQIQKREENALLFYSGVKRFCYGLGKKVLISNILAEAADGIWAIGAGSVGTVLAWFGAICYTLQIYYDFSGYSDMAIGLGRMFGFRFKENFAYPYLSASVQEFWRRWHISLSSWFKEYVYIPLGGNRKGAICTYRNLFLVFLLTGIWHGANFTFVAWGLFHGFFLIAERLFLKKLLDKNPIKVLNHLYTMLVVVVGWVFFRSDNIFAAGHFVSQMFSFRGSNYSIFSFLSMKLLIVLCAAFLCSGLMQTILKRPYDKIKKYFAVDLVDFVLQLVILLSSMIMITSGTYNPFIYFQF